MNRSAHDMTAGTQLPPLRAATGGLTFDVAASLGVVEAAWDLVYRAYRHQEIVPPNPFLIHTVAEAIGPHTAVISGRIAGLTASTLTAIADGPEGLPLDRAIPNFLNGLRHDGRRPMELGLHADRRKDIERSFHTLLELMRHAYWFGRQYDVTDYLYRIPTPHVSLYRHAFGFEPLTTEAAVSEPNRDEYQVLRLDAATVTGCHAEHQVARHIMEHPISAQEFEKRFRFEPEDLYESRIMRFVTKTNVT